MSSFIAYNGQFFQFHLEDADFSELCGSAPPHPVHEQCFISDSLFQMLFCTSDATASHT